MEEELRLSTLRQEENIGLGIVDMLPVRGDGENLVAAAREPLYRSVQELTV